MPALIGVLSLGLLYLLLRQHLAGHPRLILFCLPFAAWSPQLLLYFRQSRSYAFMAFGVIAAFFLYERWWRTGRDGYLAALTLVATLAFFNHYIGGATPPRQWLVLAAAGAVVVALGAAYLVWLGVIVGERSGFLAFTGVVGIERSEHITAHYTVVAQPDVFYFPTQRPELNWHSFAPLPAGESGVHILRAKTDGRVRQQGRSRARPGRP